MYIAQFLICMAQICSVVEQEPYVMYQDLDSCKHAAAVTAKELVVLLKDKHVEAVGFSCVDKTNSIV